MIGKYLEDKFSMIETFVKDLETRPSRSKRR